MPKSSFIMSVWFFVRQFEVIDDILGRGNPFRADVDAGVFTRFNKANPCCSSLEGSASDLEDVVVWLQTESIQHLQLNIPGPPANDPEGRA